MKPTVLVAIILIAAGVVMLAYQGITYKTRENIVDLGPIHITEEKTKTLPLPPILGGIALVSGIALLVLDKKKS